MSTHPVTSYLPDTLRSLRARRRLTPDQLAIRTEIPRQYLDDLEAGRRVPTYPVLCRLAEALGTSPSVLAGEHWGTCRTCLFWSATAPEANGAQACMRVRHSRDAEKDGELAWVADSEDYVAILYTKADFGCTLWQRRLGDPEEDGLADDPAPQPAR